MGEKPSKKPSAGISAIVLKELVNLVLIALIRLYILFSQSSHFDNIQEDVFLKVGKIHDRTRSLYSKQQQRIKSSEYHHVNFFGK